MNVIIEESLRCMFVVWIVFEIVFGNEDFGIFIGGFIEYEFWFFWFIFFILYIRKEVFFKFGLLDGFKKMCWNDYVCVYID